MESLSSLSLTELAALHEAYVTASSLMVGYQNQPRCEKGPSRIILEAECDRLVGLAEEIAEEAFKRRPTGRHEIAIRARLVAAFRLELEDWCGAMRIISDIALQPHLAA